MKVFILSGLILLSAVISDAAGREEAYRICEAMDFDSHKRECISKIRNYEYFELQAISICVGFDFDSGRLPCVDAIGDKSYDNYELRACSQEHFDSEKLKCLESSGKPAYNHPNYGCISKSELQRELQRLERLVQLNDNGRAIQLIRRLEREVSCY